MSIFFFRYIDIIDTLNYVSMTALLISPFPITSVEIYNQNNELSHTPKRLQSPFLYIPTCVFDLSCVPTANQINSIKPDQAIEY